MGIVDKIFGGGAKSIIDSAGTIIDNIAVSDDEKAKAKEQLTNIVLTNLNQLKATQGEVLKAEMTGNKLQRNWRPLMMLTFGTILVCKWFGWTDASIPEALEMKLMDIIELGLTGYVAGRSLEKISENVTKNVDLSFLKKKDRKDILE